MTRQHRRLKTVTCLLWLATALSCLVILSHRTTLLRIWRAKSSQSLTFYGADTTAALIPVSDEQDEKQAGILVVAAVQPAVPAPASLRRGAPPPGGRASPAPAPASPRGARQAGEQAEFKVKVDGAYAEIGEGICKHHDHDWTRAAVALPRWKLDVGLGWRICDRRELGSCMELCDQTGGCSMIAHGACCFLFKDGSCDLSPQSSYRSYRKPAVASAPAAVSALAPAAASEPYGAKYGFYIHAYGDPAAVVHQVREVKKHFPGSPIYVMSDGGLRFDGLCQAENCTFRGCPPANDRWHPWPFFRRMWDAAVKLNTEYVIMLEPDNTIHGPITRHPTHDAGGLRVQGRRFRLKEQFSKPGFKWGTDMEEAGLCGGSYYRTAAVLDAFSDEAVAEFNWNALGEGATKEMFSSDFAMPYLLAARGYKAHPWDDAAQMEKSKEIPWSGPADAAIKHYGGGFPGGKPTYRLRLSKEDERLVKPALSDHNRFNSNCQVCYNLKTYIDRFGSDRCTNHIPFEYSGVLRERYPGR